MPKRTRMTAFYFFFTSSPFFYTPFYTLRTRDSYEEAVTLITRWKKEPLLNNIWRTWTEDFSYRHVVIEAPISEDDQFVTLLRSSWRSSPLFSLPSGKSRSWVKLLVDFSKLQLYFKSRKEGRRLQKPFWHYLILFKLNYLWARY